MPNTTSRLALQQPLGPDPVSELRTAITSNASTLDAAALWIEDVIANRPVSTGGSPGLKGRFFLATDQTPAPGILYFDYGTGWQPLNLVDQPAGTPSLRSLGTGAQQALPGNYPGLTKVFRQTHSFTMDDQTVPNQAATVLGSFFVDMSAAESVTLVEAVVHCVSVGTPASVFKVRTDHGAHGTLSDVAGLTALTPSTTQTSTTVSGGPLSLAAFDRIVVSIVTPGQSKGCTVQVVTEHTV